MPKIINTDRITNTPESKKFIELNLEPNETNTGTTVPFVITNFLDLADPSPTNIARFTNELIVIIKQFIVEYTFKKNDRKKIITKLNKLIESANTINNILSDEPFNYYMRNNIKDALLQMQKKGIDTYMCDEFLYDIPQQQILLFNLLNNVFAPVAHRPQDGLFHKNSIDKEFVKKLMSLYVRATGKQPTPRSVSSQNPPFIIFAEKIQKTINNQWPQINNGYCLNINFSSIVKTLKHL